MQKFSRGDFVQVISGDHKGVLGRIERVFPKISRIYVEGVRCVRHIRPSESHPEGGKIEKFVGIHYSNIAHYDEDAKQRSRCGFQRDDQGKKLRVLKKTKKILEKG